MNLLRNTAASGLLAAMILFAGCTNTQRITELESELSGNATRVEALQAELAASKAQQATAAAEAASKAKALADAQAAAEAAEARMKAQADMKPAAATYSAGSSMDLLPPNAKPGECYARVVIPPVTRTETEQITTREAGEKVSTVPARYEWTEERVLISEARDEAVEVKPAEYRWVEERMEIEPASFRLEEVPEVFETVSERIMTKPARQVWKSTQGRIYGSAVAQGSDERVMTNAAGDVITRTNASTGELMCLVEEPAEYRTVQKRVLKTKATSRRVEIPAKYQTVRKRVLVREAQVVTRNVPARYETVRVKKLVEPAKEVRTPVPAQYGSVTKTVVVSEAKAAWSPVLCEANINRDTVMSLQRALQAKGNYSGPIDGIYGPLTTSGVAAFQKANSMATGGLTLRTLDTLNVRY